MLVIAKCPGQPIAKLCIPCAAGAQEDGAKRRVALALVREPYIAPDDRLDACFPGRAVELDQAEDVRQIGQRQSRHAVARCGSDCIVDAHGAVDDRVLAVDAQMDEGRLTHGLPLGC
jgi:hypothetical protein